MAGLLGNIAFNPLVNMGMGLLNGGGPNNPNQFGAGMQSGLLNMQNAAQLQQRQNAYAQAQQIRQQQLAMAQEKAKREAAVYQQQQKTAQELAAVYAEDPLKRAAAMANPSAAAAAVFQPPDKPRMYQGADGYKYWADGPNAGQRVNPNVEKTPEVMTPYQKAMVGLKRDELNATKGPDAKETFGNADKFLDEFNKQSEDFVKIRDAYARILSVDATAAGDMSMIFNYMKMLDPGSTVREGEYASAKNAAGVSDRIKAQYNSMLRGEGLAPAQRADFKAQANNLYNSQLGSQKFLADEYSSLSQKFSVDPSLVVTDKGAPITKIIGELKDAGMSEPEAKKAAKEIKEERKVMHGRRNNRRRQSPASPGANVSQWGDL